MVYDIQNTVACWKPNNSHLCCVFAAHSGVLLYHAESALMHADSTNLGRAADKFVGRAQYGAPAGVDRREARARMQNRCP